MAATMAAAVVELAAMVAAAAAEPELCESRQVLPANKFYWRATTTNMYTARHAIQTIAYSAAPPRYTSIGGFLDSIKEYTLCDYNVGAAEESLYNIVNSNSNYNSDNILARQTLVKEDCKLLLDYLRSHSSDLIKVFDSESNPNSIITFAEEASNYIRSLGLPVNTPNIFFVENYPPPFTDRNFLAINADYGDYIAHGIQEGIYLKTNFLRPIYTKYLLLHELIHSVLGQHSPCILARGLEEGICELIGAFYLSEKLLGINTTINLYILNRLSPQSNSGTSLYLDYTRQAAILLAYGGWEFLFNLIKSGREEIKKVERLLWSGEFQESTIRIEPYSLIAKVKTLLGVCSPLFSCSPLAFYLSQSVNQGDTVKELSHRTGISIDGCLRGLQELETEFNYVVLRKDNAVVSFSDCENIVSPLTLRYII